MPIPAKPNASHSLPIASTQPTASRRVGHGSLKQWRPRSGRAPVFVTLLSMLLVASVSAASGGPPAALTINLEVDWLVAADHTHKPTPCEMAQMQWSFQRAGHKINIEMGNAITETTALQVIELGGDGFDAQTGTWATLEATHRGHAAGTGWHYSVFAHNYSTDGVFTNSSGLAELRSDESIVTLGSSTTNAEAPFWRASTLMHELGHNLGLQHSGGQNEGGVGPFKANYPSLMSYRYQLNGINNQMLCEELAQAGSSDFFELDFSYGQRPSLDENSLDENSGLGLGTSIDWDCSGSAGGSVAVDISNVIDRCSGGTELQVVKDYDDWSNIANYTATRRSEPSELISCISLEEQELLERATRGDCTTPAVCGLPIGCERSIQLNETQWGFFSQQCPSETRLTSYGRRHTFTVLSNTLITIDLKSDEADTFLYLLRPDGSLYDTDNDGGSGTNSRFQGNLAPGDWTIEATTWLPSISANYELTLEGVFFPTLTLSTAGTGSGVVNWAPGLDCGNDCFGTFEQGDEVTLVPIPGPDSTFAGWSGGPCTGFGTCVFNIQAVEQITASFGANCEADIQVGDDVSAALVSDCVSFNRPGSFARYYSFDIAQEVDIVVDMGSGGGLDPYLFLLAGDATGSVIAQDDDAGPGQSARIAMRLAAGTYTIEATAFEDLTGSFLVDLQGTPVDPTRIFADGFEFGSVTRWSTATGLLSPVHRWSFTTDGTDGVGDADANLLGGTTISSKKLELNGEDGYVSLPIANTLAGLDSATIEVWVQIDTLETWSRIFDFGTGTMVNWFATPRALSGYVRAAITTGGVPGEQILEGTDPLFPGSFVFVHFAVTIDAATQTAVMYVDGSAVDSQTWTLTLSAMGPLTNLWLGRSQYPDPYLDGSFDEVRIWDRALTAAQIFQSHLRGPDDL